MKDQQGRRIIEESVTAIPVFTDVYLRQRTYKPGEQFIFHLSYERSHHGQNPRLKNLEKTFITFNYLVGNSAHFRAPASQDGAGRRRSGRTACAVAITGRSIF